MSGLTRVWLPAAWILGAAAVYGVGLFNTFQYDDYHMVAYNPAIRALAGVPQMFTDTGVFSGTEQVRHYRPLVLASYAVDYAVSGAEPWAYHATNIILHGLTAWLVALLAGSWGLARLGALAAGLIFLLAPAHSEAANYVAARSSLLATAFSVAALYAYARFRTLADGSTMGAAAWLGSAYLAFGLGLLSKEIVIVVPGLMMAYDLVTLSARRDRGFARLLVPYVPLVVGATAYLWRGRVIGTLAAIAAGEGNGDPILNGWTQLRVAVRALGLYAWPSGLSVHHEIAMSVSVTDWRVLLSAVVLLGFTGAAVWAARRGARGERGWSVPALGWFWFVMASLPTSVIPLHIPFQEHRLYFPGVGVALALGWAAQRLADLPGIRMPGIRRALIAAGSLAVIVMAAVDVQRTRLWGDGLALWRDAAARQAPSAHILNGVGIGYLRAGDDAAALEQFAAAMRLDPGYRESFANAGYALHRLGRTDEALALYETLAAKYSTEGKYFLMAGGLYHVKGDLARAEEAYRTTIRLNPRFADAYEGLGGILFQRGAFEESVAALETAERLGLHHALLRVKLAHAYRAVGKRDQALAAAEAAWREAPNRHETADLVTALRAEAADAAALQPTQADE